VLQPIAAFVYCNRQAPAGRRWQAQDGNFHAPSGACATERKIILFHFTMEPRIK